MVYAEFGVGQVLWSMLWFFLFVIWIVLLIRIFGDLFRSDDLSGVAKVLWTLFLIVFPYLGVLVYVVARGDKMTQRELGAAKQQEAAFRSYVRDAAGTSGGTGVADELERLAGLRERGIIDQAEFDRLKAKLMA